MSVETAVPPRHLFLELVRFGIVGVAATLVHVGVAVACVEAAGLDPFVANLLAFTTAVGISYVGHMYVTFGARGAHAQRLPRFVATALLGLGLNQLIMATWVSALEWDYRGALAIVVTLVPALTYAVSKKWVFGGHAHRAAETAR